MEKIKILLCILCIAPVILGGSCPENEELIECPPFCPSTCQIPYPRNCSTDCGHGCSCISGYIREFLGGKCIPRDNCQEVCRENEEFNICGTGCPFTCNNREPCAIDVCGNGCFCKEGYILEDETQICIKIEDCPHN